MLYHNCKVNKTLAVINDPVCQSHSTVSSDHDSHLKVVLFGEIVKSGDGWTTCVKIWITGCRDCGSASWINMTYEKCHLCHLVNYLCCMDKRVQCHSNIIETFVKILSKIQILGWLQLSMKHILVQWTNRCLSIVVVC